MNIFKEMFYAVKSPGTYPVFLKNKRFKIFFYGVLLLVLYFILTIIVPLVKFQVVEGGVSGAVEKYVPEFVYDSGVLQVDMPIEWDSGMSYVKIDTSPEFYLDDIADYEIEFFRYRNVLITDGYEVLIKNNGEYASGPLEYIFGYERFDKTSLESFLPMVNGLMVAGVIVIFLFELAFFFFGILILSLIGLIVNAVVKSELTFGQIFVFSIYARTLPLAVKGIISFLPFGIPLFWVINFAISVLYLYLACSAVKRNAVPVEVNIIQ